MSTADRSVIDVSGLQTWGFGSRGLAWWGVWLFFAIETTMLVLCLGSYFYLRTQAPEWRTGVEQPPLLVPTINTLVMLASIVPMVWIERRARCFDRRSVQIGLVISVLFGVAFSVLRVVELRLLPFRWDDNAFASLVWTTMGIHTGHLVAEVFETIFITLIYFVHDPLEEKYFVDAEDNALYWYFIVAIWLPVYAVIFLSPRLL